jgi:hypothetical protein
MPGLVEVPVVIEQQRAVFDGAALGGVQAQTAVAL